MAIKSSEVVFFLGAGASVKAGVPTTYSFVEEYVNSIKEQDKQDEIVKIIDTLKKRWKKDKIDIECLLETLSKLKDRDKDPLLLFYSDRTYILKGYQEKEPFIDDLKNFIKFKGIVSEEKIDYLKFLRESIEKPKPLDIISLNYDTCIEQFCEKYNLKYQDGFDDKWNPRTFEEVDTDIRLYKLHGSVMWYQSEKRDYKKLPVMAKKSEIQLISGQKAENLMLYPMQKLDYIGPLLELLVEIKHLLESESCKYLIVVGYSFRDSHITEILWDAAKINKNLYLVLIDPKAYEIYNEQLKYFSKDDPQNKSSLNGRVICLPYLFEEVFPYLRNHYITKLDEGLRCEMGREEEVRKGQKTDWISCIKQFVDAEFIEKIESILPRTGFEPDKDLKLGFELPLKMAVNLYAGGQEEKAIKYFKDFQNLLKKVMVERIDVEIVDARGMIGIYQIQFKFNSITHHYDPIMDQKSGSYNGVPQFKDIFEPLSEFCQTRAGFIKESRNNLFKISEILRKMKDYLGTIRDGKISIEDYIKLRENKIPNIEQFTNQYEILKKDGLPLDQQRELNAILVEVERNTLREIIDEE